MIGICIAIVVTLIVLLATYVLSMRHIKPWILIPEEKYKRYFKYRPKSNLYCDCGHLNYDCEGIPYAYDEENNDVFFAHQCEKCGTIMYTKE